MPGPTAKASNTAPIAKPAVLAPSLYGSPPGIRSATKPKTSERPVPMGLPAWAWSFAAATVGDGKAVAMSAALNA
jgi:hypothetical protein